MKLENWSSSTAHWETGGWALNAGPMILWNLKIKNGQKNNLPKLEINLQSSSFLRLYQKLSLQNIFLTRSVWLLNFVLPISECDPAFHFSDQQAWAFLCVNPIHEPIQFDPILFDILHLTFGGSGERMKLWKDVESSQYIHLMVCTVFSLDGLG